MNEATALANTSVILPAAGKGQRMGEVKQYLSIAGVPLLQHTLNVFLDLQPKELVLVVAPDDDRYTSLSGLERCRVVTGGASRAESVQNALATLTLAAADWVMVHDAARPLVRRDDILALQNRVRNHAVGGLLALPVVDTVKYSKDGELVCKTVDRTGLWLAQTPQVFRYEVLQRALQNPVGADMTDEASAVEALGLEPCLVPGDRRNIKVTTPPDLAFVREYLE